MEPIEAEKMQHEIDKGQAPCLVNVRAAAPIRSVIILQHSGGFNDRLTPAPESGCRNATF